MGNLPVSVLRLSSPRCKGHHVTSVTQSSATHEQRGSSLNGQPGRTSCEHLGMGGNLPTLNLCVPGHFQRASSSYTLRDAQIALKWKDFSIGILEVFRRCVDIWNMVLRWTGSPGLMVELNDLRNLKMLFPSWLSTPSAGGSKGKQYLCKRETVGKKH